MFGWMVSCYIRCGEGMRANAILVWRRCAAVGSAERHASVVLIALTVAVRQRITHNSLFTPIAQRIHSPFLVSSHRAKQQYTR
jgi:hypothetical protein